MSFRSRACLPVGAVERRGDVMGTAVVHKTVVG